MSPRFAFTFIALTFGCAGGGGGVGRTTGETGSESTAADATRGSGEGTGTDSAATTGDGDAGTGEGGTTGEPPLDIDMFPSDRVIDVAIELAPSDWESVRKQERNVVQALARPDCQDQPYPPAFTYVEATVTVDGERRERVGVRKKGFLGSNSHLKPSLKVKFDEYVEGQLLGQHRRMTLNNNQQSPSQIAQCVAFDLFNAAGVPASRCGFAHVTVNGNDLGVFANVQPIKKRFLREHFADDEGQLYEGTLSDFRSGWMGTLEQKTNKDIPYDRADIDAVIAAAAADDGTVVARLGEVIDLPEFVSFWAMEALVGQGDGYANAGNNFYIYREPDGTRFTFIPWGIDGSMADRSGTAEAVYAASIIANRLMATTEGRDMLFARMREILDTIWDVPVLTAKIERLAAMVRPLMLDREIDRGPGFDQEITDMLEFVRDRKADIEASIAAYSDLPALRGGQCFEKVGDLSGSFATTWGTLGQDPFTAGTGTLSVTLDGQTRTYTRFGSRAGDAQGEGIDMRADVDVHAETAGGVIDRLRLNFIVDDVAAGAVLGEHTRGAGSLARPMTPISIAGDSVIEFSEGSLNPGDPFEATFEAGLFRKLP